MVVASLIVMMEMIERKKMKFFWHRNSDGAVRRIIILHTFVSFVLNFFLQPIFGKYLSIKYTSVLYLLFLSSEAET